MFKLWLLKQVLVTKKAITIETKKDIISAAETGMKQSTICAKFGLAQSTVATILKNKDHIKSADSAKGAFIITKHRPQIVEEVEKLLLVWINEKQLAGDSVSEVIICEKARRIHSDLLKESPGTSTTEETPFKASRGWFEKFRHRSGIHSVMRQGEGASSDKEAAESFTKEFKQFVDDEGLLSQQIFNCDETGLFWKKMPRRTYITQEEKSLPGHKPMKDRLTLLLCANASGDCRIKPLLIYHSTNPRAFKKHNVEKAQLPVMWRANTKAWVTRPLFSEWLSEVFAPSVKEYLLKNDLPLKCCLLMDNAPAHPPSLKDEMHEKCEFITVKFLPPNTTPLIQPMDQQVIANFKKLYTKYLFKKCFDVTSDSELSLRDFWRDHYNIYHCVWLINKSWQSVSTRALNAAWKN